MGWTLKFKSSVEKDLSKIPPKDRQRIFAALEQVLDDPRQQGKSLKGDKRELWCYRIGTYRVLCDLQDNQLVVLVVRVGHRRDVYR